MPRSQLHPLAWLGPLLLSLLAACAQPHPSPSPPESAESVLRRLEQRLLTAPVLRLRYRIHAEGAFSAALQGELLLNSAEHAHLAATGTFGGAPVSLHLTAAQGQMQGGSARQVFNQPTPEHLRAALVLGLTRMGILHNLARLSSGRPPDHAEGGVEEWVQPREVVWMKADSQGAAAHQGLHFGIQVAGQRTAEAELWLDSRGLPVRRRQVVRFPGGQMSVLEEYEVISPES